jgi:lipopolysaccharide export system protein LptA
MLVMVAAVLLLAALAIFLAAAKWKSRLGHRDLPEHLAKEIQQQANGFNFVHTFGTHSQYKIHASQEVQLRDNRVLLHGVQIELYGGDGSSMDQIAGDTFEFDQKSGLVIAEGPVEMVLTQPASTKPTGQQAGNLPTIAAPKQIRVKTSGVTFDRDSGMVTTLQRVDFVMTQGAGSSVGATYDSQNGYLTLDHAVELTTQRSGRAVTIRAQHAEFDRGAQTCWLRAATADDRGAKAGAAQAEIFFREDGSTQRLEATGGFTLATSNGGRVAAPKATMDFDGRSEPLRGRLEDGVTLDSVTASRAVHGTSPIADLEFASQGKLRRTHLERGVEFTERQQSGIRDQGSVGTASAEGNVLSISRTWRSPLADIEFRDAGKGQVEPASIHGTGGVAVTSESRRGNQAVVPSKMSAEEVTGMFGRGSTLRSLTGTGHAGIEQVAANGTKQTVNSDRLEASFAEGGEQAAPARKDRTPGTSAELTGTREQGNADQVESAELDGHVVLFEQPAPRPGGQVQPPLRATSGKATYEGAGEWLHLTQSPRVTEGGLELTADKVDVTRQSGDAFAHGNVKATWTGGTTAGQAASAGSGQGATAFGGSGPAHVIADEAQMNESTGEADFRGRARLWQQANSVTAPVIVLNQHTQTLSARTADTTEPVHAVLLSAGGPPGKSAGRSTGQSGNANQANKPGTSSVITVRGGDLWYSDAEHRAVMHAGALDAVVAETGTGTSSSDQLDLRLKPSDVNGGQTQVDRMTATGHVVLTSQGRRGTGEQLVYSSLTGDYALTGTAAAAPRMSDPAEGSVTGETLIFHSRDDSVSIEGGDRGTITETTAPEAHGK